MKSYNPFSENDDFDDNEGTGGFSGTFGSNDPGFAWGSDEEDVPKPAPESVRSEGGKKSTVKSSDVIVVNKKKSNVLFRNIILVSCALLMAFGVFRIVHPQKTLSNTEITAIASAGLNVTAFPAQNAQVYIQKFSEVFFSADTDRSAKLAKYGDPDPSFVPAEGTKIISGPFVGGVEYQSDTTASFTISANMSSTGWVYFSVPVYYDKSSDSFTVLGDPSAVPAPATLSGSVTLDDNALGTTQDDTTVSAVRPVVETFLKAYGASDQNALKTVTLDGVSDARAFAGFGGKYSFLRLSQIEVRRKPTMPATNYWVVVSVSWSYAPTSDAQSGDQTGSTSGTSSTSFNSKYQLKVQNTNGKYYIVDIQPVQYYATSTSSTSSTQDAEPTANTQ